MAFDISKLNKNSREFLIITKVSIQDYFNRVIVPDMPWYFDEKSIDFEFKPTTKCPLHSEDTASFRNYWNGEGSETYSSFYCFGCGKGGTVINLHMDYVESKNDRKISKEQAIKDLYELFSDKIGSNVNFRSYSPKSGVKAKILPANAVEHIEQNKADQFEFERVYFKVDKQLQIEDIDLEVKKEMYQILDDSIRLVRDNIVYAKDALKYVKDACYEHDIFI